MATQLTGEPMRRIIHTVLLFLAACSSSAAPTTEPGSPTPSPTPGLEALRDAYVEIADAANVTTCAFDIALRESSDVALIQRRARENAVAMGVNADALRALAFPADLQDDVDRLIASREALEADMLVVADAPTEDAMNTAIEQMLEASRLRGSGTANAIREGLGLPRVDQQQCDG